MHSTTTLATRGFSVVFLPLLFSTLLNAQIKIKERVEINPISSKVINNSISSDLPATVHLVFTAETDAPIRLACPNSTLYGYHSISTDVCTYEGFYYYQVNDYQFTTPTDVPYTFTGSV